MKLIYALCGLLLANAAWAVPDVVVDGVLMPAWVERGAQRMPLAAGMELQSGDALVTGAGSRVQLKTADGSDIRLGENARLVLDKAGQRHDARPQFEAALALEKGAFRFATPQRGKPYVRNVAVKVAGVTVSIDKGDIWGKTEEDGTGMVLLLDGLISVAHGNEALLVMGEPLTSIVMSKDAAPLPMSGTDQKRVDKLVQETAIADGLGAVRSGGKWKVNLMVQEGEAAALESYDALRAAGYDVRILPLSGGKFRLRILQLPNRAEAEVLAHNLSGKMGIVSPSVSR